MRFVASLIGILLTAFAGPALAQTNVTAPRAPVASITELENLLYLDLSTGGRVVIWLRPDVAPKMVERVKTLARQHFYDGLLFHRVIEGFMAQTGDPKGDGTGGSTLPDLTAEFNYLPHVRGAVSAAREGASEGATVEDEKKAENTANSQFFIVFSPTLKLDGKYTVFGRVVSGMDYVDAVTRGEPPTNPSRILHAYVAADNPPAYVAAPVPAIAPATLPKAAPKPAKVRPAAAPKKKAA